MSRGNQEKLINYIFTILLFPLFLTSCNIDNKRSVSYWLWAGITTDDAPPNSEYYIYQGRIDTETDEPIYTRLGLYPHPLKSSKVVLVYRINGLLPNVNYVVDLFLENVAHWHSHPLKISGIQLDFDSPTSKLPEYSKFLNEFRKHLSEKYIISITGLGDWLFSNQQQSLFSISTCVDEIVFQLYQGRSYLYDFDKFVIKLSEYTQSFRIGLLHEVHTPSTIESLKSNPNYGGIIYFIQKNL